MLFDYEITIINFNRTLNNLKFQSLTDNIDLRMLFCYNWGDFGTPPSRSGFPMQALLHNHYQYGKSILHFNVDNYLLNRNFDE